MIWYQALPSVWIWPFSMILWSKCKIVQNYMKKTSKKNRRKLNIMRGWHFKEFKIFKIKILVGSVTAAIPRVRENTSSNSFIKYTSFWLDNLYYLAWVPERKRVFYKQYLRAKIQQFNCRWWLWFICGKEVYYMYLMIVNFERNRFGISLVICRSEKVTLVK